MKIMVMGDVHRDFGALNSLVAKKRPDIVLSAGDFGYWPGKPNTWTRADGRIMHKKVIEPKMGKTKLYFCDGNHEDHWALKKLESNEVYPNVFWMKRESVMTLEDGRVVMFMGGAISIDKANRKLGYDWFPDEEISYSDVHELPEVKVDIVVSHTCPREFEMMGEDIRQRDNSRMALSYVLMKYEPKQWYFGHWHFFKRGEYRGCKWVGLSMSRETGWWEWLV